MTTKLAVKQPEPPKEEIAAEVIADAIVAISDGIAKLRQGRLNDKALLLLVQHAAPEQVSQRDIKNVLAGIQSLKTTYLKKL
jgi:hypothetical protein